jgi:hypothetical protein
MDEKKEPSVVKELSDLMREAAQGGREVTVEINDIHQELGRSVKELYDDLNRIFSVPFRVRHKRG